MSSTLKIGGIIAISIVLLTSGFVIGYVLNGYNPTQAVMPGYCGAGSWMGAYGGMMGQTGLGGMMSGVVPNEAQDGREGEALTLDEAVKIAEQYIEGYSTENLELAEVMQFNDHFYAQAREADTGINAFEVLIDPYTAAIYPEPGPNMMWNTKYGMMGGSTGMMGGRRGRMGGYATGDPEAEMSISPDKAREYAQAALDSSLAGATIDDEVDVFYGYYTIHTLRDGEIIGMLSVNGYTGQVWLHTWHGEFIDMTEHSHD